MWIYCFGIWKCCFYSQINTATLGRAFCLINEFNLCDAVKAVYHIKENEKG